MNCGDMVTTATQKADIFTLLLLLAGIIQISMTDCMVYLLITN